jgi:large subunit ribosomal protein L2
MAIKVLKPTTPTRRHTILVDRSSLSKVKPFKALTTKVQKSAGRNNQGRVTVRHRQAGSKNAYRIIDFKRNKYNIEAVVETVEYDPNRTAFIALLKYADGERRYILAPDKVKVGDKIESGDEAPVKEGNSLPLKLIPQGTYVHAVELYPGQGATLGRSAGTMIQVMGGDKGYAQLRLPSGEMRVVRETCFATIGSVSNPDQKNVKLGKAGRSRHLGVRPTVRGVAQSLYHPHGGGQGKGGRHGTGGPAKDLWGNRIGTRTRKNRKITSKFILKRRPSKNKFKKYKNVI